MKWTMDQKIQNINHNSRSYSKAVHIKKIMNTIQRLEMKKKKQHYNIPGSIVGVSFGAFAGVVRLYGRRE